MIVHKNMKMLQKLLIFPFLFVAIYGAGEFSVLQTPPSLEWKGDDVLKTESVRDLVSASVGVWTRSNSEWSGLYIRDPLSTPKSAVTIFVDGLDKLDVTPKPAFTYKTAGDSDSIHADFDTWDTQNPSDDIVNVDLEKVDEHPETFSNIFDVEAPSTLNKDLHSEDKTFLTQIAYINALAKKIRTEKNLPKSLLVIVSVNGLVTAHGESSPAIEDVKKTLAEAIENLNKSVAEAANSNALVTLITHKSDGQTRTKRDVGPTPSNSIDIDKLNIAEYYSEDYPVIFNIILWFMVAFALALLAICYVIGDMDPGRDSIIYRMTSTRMKKDN